MTIDSDRRKINRGLRRSQAEIQHLIDCFGDHLAQKHKYNRSGIEAVWFYLVQTYRWTPAVVRALNTEDLDFLLHDEMNGWKAPNDDKPGEGYA
ncbi:hypothetical protein ACVWZZ_008552 [Bradyrhizobium sp. LM6.10]